MSKKSPPKSEYDKKIDKLKNDKLIATIAACAFCFIAIVQFFGAVKSVRDAWFDPELKKERRELKEKITEAQERFKTYQGDGGDILEKLKVIQEWNPTDQCIDRLNLANQLLVGLEKNKEMIKPGSRIVLAEMKTMVDKNLERVKGEKTSGELANGVANGLFTKELKKYEKEITNATNEWLQLNKATTSYLDDALTIASGERVPLEAFNKKCENFRDCFRTRIADAAHLPILYEDIISKIHPKCLSLLDRK